MLIPPERPPLEPPAERPPLEPPSDEPPSPAVLLAAGIYLLIPGTFIATGEWDRGGGARIVGLLFGLLILGGSFFFIWEGWKGFRRR